MSYPRQNTIQVSAVGSAGAAATVKLPNAATGALPADQTGKINPIGVNSRWRIRALLASLNAGSLPPTGLGVAANVSGGTFAAATYFWQVTATGGISGESLPTAEVSVAIALDGSATLTWTAAAGATGYRIYRSTVSGGEATTPAFVAAVGAVTTYTDTGTAVGAGAVPATKTPAGSTLTITDGVFTWTLDLSTVAPLWLSPLDIQCAAGAEVDVTLSAPGGVMLGYLNLSVVSEG